MIPVTAAGSSGDGSDDRLAQMRALVLRLGQARFGPAPQDIKRRIGEITDATHLEQLAERMLVAERWEDLFVKEQGRLGPGAGGKS